MGPGVGDLHVFSGVDAPDFCGLALPSTTADSLGDYVAADSLEGVTARRDEPFGRLGALYVGVEQTMNAGGEGMTHLPGVVTDLFGRVRTVRQRSDDRRCGVTARGGTAVFQAPHELVETSDVEMMVLKIDEDHVGPCLGHLASGVITEFGRRSVVERLSFLEEVDAFVDAHGCRSFGSECGSRIVARSHTLSPNGTGGSTFGRRSKLGDYAHILTLPHRAGEGIDVFCGTVLDSRVRGMA